MFKLVVFDVAGTIVSDDGVVLDAFEEAFTSIVPEQWLENSDRFIEYAKKTMGQSKIEVFYSLLGDQRLAAAAADSFQSAYLKHMHRAKEFDGIPEMFQMLRAKGIRVALNTGFNRPTLETMIEHFGWRGLIDGSATPQEAGAGRPSPAMLRLVASQLGVTDHSMVAVLGDTATDIETAKAFGAGLSIGVLTGAHGAKEFEDAGADLVLSSATEALPHLVS